MDAFQHVTEERHRSWATVLTLLTLLVTLGSRAAAMEPPRVDQKAFLTRAVFVDGRLWLLTDAGELSSIAEGGDRRIDEALPEPVNDICIHQGKLLALSCAREDCAQGTLRRQDNQTWTISARFPTGHEHVIALGCDREAIDVLTDRRLIEVKGDDIRSVELSERLNLSSVAAVHDMPDGIFVGFNAGEWGGGLQRIDRQSGKVRTIASNLSGDLCGGPLNTDCDPINSIVTSPWNDRCVVAAIGLVHFLPHGRVVEVCGRFVRRLYFSAYKMQGIDEPPSKHSYEPFSLGKILENEPHSTTAFYGLLARGDALWAIGIDGLYKIDRDGSAEITPIPEFREIGGVHVSFDLADMILVLTQVNQRRSVGGAVPLLVPRQP